jgi:NAD(P)-dependent dehydrogenase (short-subunit alcohol dehydrogenase family)
MARKKKDALSTDHQFTPYEQTETDKNIFICEKVKGFEIKHEFDIVNKAEYRLSGDDYYRKDVCMQPQQQESTEHYALILGASSGFGKAAALRLADAGFHIFGVHLDRQQNMPMVEELIHTLQDKGSKVTFFNINAANAEKRKEVVQKIRSQLSEDAKIKVMLHSLAFGTLKPFIGEGGPSVLSRANMIMTMDVMAHSMVYWTQELFGNHLLGYGSRIFAMTSHGSTNVLPYYGAVSAAKSALESHVRQLALELGSHGVTVNALKAGVTDTPALQKIPGHERMIEISKRKNPSGRLTTPDDVARAIVNLCNMDAQWINGDVISVDFGESVMDK